MKTSKLVTLLLAMLLALGLFAGAAGAESGMPDVDISDHIDISVAIWDVSGPDQLLKQVEDACNVTIDLIPLSWDNATEQLMLLAAADDLPDISATYGYTSNIARFYDWIDQGMVRSIPKDMIAKYPNLSGLFDACDAVQTIAGLKGGEYWYIPRLDSVSGMYKCWQTRIYYRKDWMANVGIEKAPETLDEYYEMLRAFTFDDPDGNGKNDTIGFTGGGALSLMNCFTTPSSGWSKIDGKWVPDYYGADWVAESLEYLQKMYREGILDPEFHLMSDDQQQAAVAANRAGSVLRNGNTVQIYDFLNGKWGAANPGQNPLDVWDILPPLKRSADDADGMWLVKGLDSGANEISSKVDDQKLDRIMYVSEYLLQPEGLALKRFGLEGETYDIVDGKVVLRNNPDTGSPYDLYDFYPSKGFFALISWDMDYQADPVNYVGPIPEEYRELSAAMLPLYDAAYSPEINFTPGTLNTPTRSNYSVNTSDAYKSIVVGDEDVDVALAKFRDDCLAKGLQSLIDEVTAEMTALGF